MRISCGLSVTKFFFLYTRWMSIAWWASCLSTWGKRAGTLLLSPTLCFCEKLILLLFSCPSSDTPRSFELDLMTTLLLELLFLLIFNAFSPFYNFQLTIPKGKDQLWLPLRCWHLSRQNDIDAPLLFYSIRYILSQIDNCIQFGEDADVKVKDFEEDEDDD